MIGIVREPPVAGYPLTLSVMATGTFLAMTAYTGPLGNGVTLAAEFGSTTAGLSWILASMSVGLAVTLLPAGVVADRWGRRRVFVLGALVFVVSNVACALADSTGLFVLARIGAGVGATGMIATGLGLVTALPGAATRQATTSTWWSIAMGCGIAAGPVVAGLLDLIDSWRWFYVLLAAGGIVTGVGAIRSVPRDLTSAAVPARRFDVLGFILLLAFLAVFITAVVEMRSRDVPGVLSLFTASAILLTGLVISQSVGSRRLIAPELLRRRAFLAATGAGLGAGLGVVSIMAFVPTYLVLELGMSTVEAGATSTLWSATSAVAALAFSRFSAAVSGPTQLVCGLLGVSIGVLLMSGVSSDGGLPRLMVGLVIAGIATGVLNGGLARQSTATVPPDDAAMGTAATNTARYLGGAIGVSLASIIVAGPRTAEGWDVVVWAVVGVSLLSAVVVLWSRGLPAIVTLRRFTQRAVSRYPRG